MNYILKFLLARLNIIYGGILIALGIFLFLSLATYNEIDPSFNRATGQNIHNIGGKYGAYIADPILDFLGFGSIILIVIPLIWGVLLLIKNTLTWFWLKFVMLLLCILSCSAVVSLLKSSYGGLIGNFIAYSLDKAIDHVFIAPILISTFILSFLLSAGLSYADWGAVFSFVTNFVARLKFFSQYQEEEIESEFTETVKKKPLVNLRKKPTVSKEEVKKPAVKSSTNNKFQLPSLSFLHQVTVKANSVSEATLKQNAKDLEKTLEDFGITGKIVGISPGPVVTLYELEPAAGIKASRVIGLADDIARSMSAVSARIAVVPGKNVIGIEMPNKTREMVYLKELLASDEYQNGEFNLPIVVGKNIAGTPIVVDLAKMPHLLVAGTTGSGKSVAINTMILSLLYKLTPEECKFIMVDPKMLELSIYDGIPHLLTPVVTEPGKAIVALKWVVKEMENRYRLMSTLSVRNVDGYNKRIQEAVDKNEPLERVVQTGFDPGTGQPIFEKIPLPKNKLPFIVVIVDEMADLMLIAGKDIETSIQRLAQMARAAGIHIIMATQRPSVDVITGVIKANLPTRISFQVTSRIDSRTILGEQGAEQLLGRGDMLYMSGGGKIIRVHGPFVDDSEVEKVVSFLKEQATPEYIAEVTISEEDAENFSDDGETDELYDQAVVIVTRDRKASTSYIQRCLRIGYNRAASIIEKMEREGVVGPANHVGKREVLAPSSN